MTGGGPMAVYLYLLGRHADALRVATGAGELVLPRAHRLPLRALREAARAGGYLGACPWVEGADCRALVALWTYAQDHERAVVALPADLAPQVIVHAPVGATLLWILPAPYPEAPADGRPDAAALLAELAEALGTIPASPADMLPVPLVEADLVILNRDGTADPEALWTWAHGTAEAVREQARRAASERAAAAAREAEVASADAAARTKVVSGGNDTDIEDKTTPAPVAEAAPAESRAEPEACEAGWPQGAPDPLKDSASPTGRGSDTATGEAPQITDAPLGTAPETTDRTGEGEAAAPTPGAETAAVADHVASEIGRETVRGLIDGSSASDAEHEETGFAIDGGSPDSVGTSPGEGIIAAGNSSDASSLPASLLALLVAAARAQRLPFSDALAEAVAAYALAVLGTQEVHNRLAVQLTWKRSDGLYGLTRDHEWRKLTEL